jgi:hypothetical protein
VTSRDEEQWNLNETDFCAMSEIKLKKDIIPGEDCIL